jgi:hypothetical protein
MVSRLGTEVRAGADVRKEGVVNFPSATCEAIGVWFLLWFLSSATGRDDGLVWMVWNPV